MSSSSSKRKSEPILNHSISSSGSSNGSIHSSNGTISVILENSIQQQLSKSGGIDRPIPPPIENKPKRPLSLSIGTLSPQTSPPLDGIATTATTTTNSISSGNTSPVSSTSISPSTSQLSLSKAQFKMPPKSNSIIFSVIYDKTNSSLEFIDEEDLFQRISIQKLLLGRNKLTYIPERISELTKLTVLDLSHNRLKSLPVQVSELTELSQLNLSGNKFMISATKENEFILNNSNNSNNSNNNTNHHHHNNNHDNDQNDNSSTITTTESSPISSPEILINEVEQDKVQQQQQEEEQQHHQQQKQQQQQQQENNVVDDSLNYIPWELSYVVGLKKLDLSSNQCRDDDWDGLNLLPSSIFWFTQIEVLNISGCQLKSISSDIQHLESLTSLDISQNSLTEIPIELSQLFKLKTLVLSFNEITCIPKELVQLSKSLVNLDLSNNIIQELPDNFCEFIYLESLNLSNNQIKVLPDMMFPEEYNSDEDSSYGLYSLISFKCRGNLISVLPNGFFQTIRYIKTLDLSVNMLKTLPILGINELDHISTLLLFNNQLEELPKELFEPTSEDNLMDGNNCSRNNLTVLNASGNKLKSIPDGIWKCKSLSNLSLGYNEIKVIEFPVMNSQVYYSLEELYLNGNKDLEINVNVSGSASQLSLEWFPSLREISIASCDLSEIPKFIRNVKSLEKLDLSNNRISVLPKTTLEELDRLQVLLLTNNQLYNIDSTSISLLKSLTTLDLSLNPCLENTNNNISKNNINDLNQLIESLTDTNFILNNVPSSNSIPKSGLNNNNNNNNFKKNGNQVHSVVYNKSDRFKIYYSDIIGRRPTMEDSFSIHGRFNDNPKMDLISLFDGHAGDSAAIYSSEHFPRIMKSLVTMFPSIPPLQWLKQAYSEITSEFRSYIQNEKPELKYCGATAASLLIIEDYYCVSNIGDTRIVLCQDSKAKRLSFDHKPGDPGETKRISKLGGYVISNQHTSRVNGTLALSRSIGDFYMEPYVISDPYLNLTKRNLESDQFIIVACDGIWDEISDQLACDIVLSSSSMKEAVNRLKDYAYFSGSDDNISVIIVDLKPK